MIKKILVLLTVLLLSLMARAEVISLQEVPFCSWEGWGTSGQNEKRFEPIYSYTTTDIKAVENAENMDVYSIDGRLVRKQVKSTNDLEKGFYIVNGKKVAIK